MSVVENETERDAKWRVRVNIALLVSTCVLLTVIVMYQYLGPQSGGGCTCNHAKTDAAIEAIKTDIMWLKTRQIGIGSPIGSPVGSPVGSPAQ